VSELRLRESLARSGSREVIRTAARQCIDTEGDGPARIDAARAVREILALARSSVIGVDMQSYAVEGVARSHIERAKGFLEAAAEGSFGRAPGAARAAWPKGIEAAFAPELWASDPSGAAMLLARQVTEVPYAVTDDQGVVEVLGTEIVDVPMEVEPAASLARAILGAAVTEGGACQRWEALAVARRAAIAATQGAVAADSAWLSAVLPLVALTGDEVGLRAAAKLVGRGAELTPSASAVVASLGHRVAAKADDLTYGPELAERLLEHIVRASRSGTLAPDGARQAIGRLLLRPVGRPEPMTTATMLDGAVNEGFRDWLESGGASHDPGWWTVRGIIRAIEVKGVADRSRTGDGSVRRAFGSEAAASFAVAAAGSDGPARDALLDMMECSMMQVGVDCGGPRALSAVAERVAAVLGRSGDADERLHTFPSYQMSSDRLAGTLERVVQAMAADGRVNEDDEPDAPTLRAGETNEDALDGVLAVAAGIRREPIERAARAVADRLGTGDDAAGLRIAEAVVHTLLERRPDEVEPFIAAISPALRAARDAELDAASSRRADEIHAVRAVVAAPVESIFDLDGSPRGSLEQLALTVALAAVPGSTLELAAEGVASSPPAASDAVAAFLRDLEGEPPAPMDELDVPGAEPAPTGRLDMDHRAVRRQDEVDELPGDRAIAEEGDQHALGGAEPLAGAEDPPDLGVDL